MTKKINLPSGGNGGSKPIKKEADAITVAGA